MNAVNASRKQQVSRRLVIFTMLAIGLLLIGLPADGGQVRATTVVQPQSLRIEREGQQGWAGLKRAAMIRLPQASFDPLQGEPQIDSSLRANPDVTQYWLVQMQPQQMLAGVAAVQQAGGVIIAPIADWAYIVRMDAAIAAKLRVLATVRWVGVYQPAYKIAGCRLQSADCGYAGSLDLVVTLFLYIGTGQQGGPPPAPTEDVVNRLRGKGFVTQQVGSDTLLVRTDTTRLAELAGDDGVRSIARLRVARVLNDRMREIGGVNAVAGYLGLYGAGQTVAVADTGLDTGSNANLSADFAGRIVAAHPLGRVGRWDDPDGHGTHVSGTALGNGANSGSQPSQHHYAGSFAGIAPEAGLVMQSILDDSGGLGGVPPNLNTLFQQAYDDGARVHSDSWGTDGNEYGIWAQQADEFVWQHPDMNIVFAAGNEGIDRNADGVVDVATLGYQANGKNILSVGASESDRQTGGLQGSYGSYWPPDFPTNPLHGDAVSNNAQGVAAFSSRGPAADGRFGISLVNLGTNVLSARSHAAGADNGWGGYNSNYFYEGGTSMAAPGVAGAAALVREFYQRYAGTQASAALVRATLLNSASDLNPGQYGVGSTREITARPNNVEGWGRLNLAAAFDLAAPLQPRFADNANGLAQGNTIDYGLDVTDAGLPLHLTLAWNDYPGFGLIDDLDLTLLAPDGSTLWGNGVAGGDGVNNAETVDIAAAARGHYTIRIAAPRIQALGGRQPFALAVTAATGGAPLPTATPTNTPLPTATPTLLPCGYFYDVPSGSPFYQYVHTLACAGAISGTSYGYYSPNSTATRAQFSRMVVKGFGLPILTPSSGYSFADVPPSYWAWQYVETAYVNGIIRGVSTGQFAPNVAVTRAQAVRMVVKARGWAITTPATPSFSDVPADYWAYIYIETAYAHGAVSGVGGSNFSPNASVTRGQVARMLYNGINLP